MKRIITLASLALVAAVSQAGINFNLNSPNAVVARPGSGFVLVTFSGTIDLSGGFAPTQGIVELPSNGSNFLAFDSFDAGFLAYLTAAVVDSDYTGNLFTLQVASTDALGLYDMNNGGFGSSPFAEAIVTATKNGIVAGDNEFYSVEVVPEPASLAILGLAAGALVARRRKS